MFAWGGRMIETTFQANGNYKERENEFVSYSFVINNEYKNNGFPAIKIRQIDDSGEIEFHIHQIDYLACLIEAITFIDKMADIGNCTAQISGSGFFLQQSTSNMPNVCVFKIDISNDKLNDETISTPYYCELSVKGLFTDFRIYGVSKFHAFKNAVQFLGSIVHL